MDAGSYQASRHTRIDHRRRRCRADHVGGRPEWRSYCAAHGVRHVRHVPYIHEWARRDEDGPNPITGPGLLTAFGEATVTIDKSNNQICVNFTDTGLGAYNLFHIHAGDDTIRNGPVVVDFAPGAGRTNPFYTCVTDTDAPAIAANPSGFYLNAHTTLFPAGAISGQLNNVFTTSPKESNLLAAPQRAYDTRFNTAGKFAPSTTRTIDLSGFGVPLSARAAIVTITVTRADAAGFLTVYSSALTTAPNTSNVNFGANVDAANNITVATDGTAKIKITSGATGNEDVIVDVVGYVS